MTTYKIVRHFSKHHSSIVVKRKLTLAQAQTHCRNPETSSQTATGKMEVLRTELHGPWFDGYEEE